MNRCTETIKAPVPLKVHFHGLSGQRRAALRGQLDLPQGLWDDLHFINFLSGRKNKGELLSLQTLAGLALSQLASEEVLGWMATLIKS